MKKTETYYFGLLLDCLTMLESSQKDLDKKLEGLMEVVLANNQLLGLFMKTLGVTDESSENLKTPLSEDLLEELIKHSADRETWGRS